jgi:hypothetical protein
MGFDRLDPNSRLFSARRPLYRTSRRSPGAFEGVSGVPLEMGTPMDRARLQVFRDLKLEAGSRINLFASRNAVMRPSTDAEGHIAAFPNVRLVIRPHP